MYLPSALQLDSAGNPARYHGNRGESSSPTAALTTNGWRKDLFRMTNTPKEVQPEGPFDDAEVISVYSDRQAVEDGFLAAVAGPGGVNRVTRAVFDHFTESKTGPENLRLLTEAIRAMLAIEPDDGWRTGDYQGKRLWLIPNEVGGLTLMFPEDY